MDFEERIDRINSDEVSELPNIDLDSSNPYTDPVIVAEIVEPPIGLYGSPPQRPRAWTSFFVVGISLICFLASSLILTLVAVFVVQGTIDLKTLGNEDTMAVVMESRIGLPIMVVFPQLALVIPAIMAAFLSPVQIRQRLSLVRGDWPIWTWVAVAFATPLIGMVSAMAISAFLPESESIKELTNIFRSHGESGFLIPLALMIGLTPAICEELLFRGYVQTRLTKSFGPIAGILTASFLFALLHMDFFHIIAVFPLGLFLGWTTWRSGSLFPAVMGHFVNNSFSVVLAVYVSEENPELIPAPAIAFMAAILACGAAGLAATCYASVAYRKPA